MNSPIVDMELPKSDVPKLPDMVMCGDHPSFTKQEANAKEAKMEEKERDKLKERILSYAKISPTASGTDRVSEHALRRSPAGARPERELGQRGNGALVQAALGSFRWPPYLLAVWVLVLVLTHVLHCIVNTLERTLPALKKLCQYFRTWTEESWKSETELNQRVYPLGLATVTGLLYAAYYALSALLLLALWAVEPLAADGDDKRAQHNELTLTDCADELAADDDSAFKQ